MGSYADDIIARLKATEQAKDRHVTQWLINLAFFKGYHYVRPTKGWGYIERLRVDDWRHRLTINHVRQIALTMASKLTQNRPTWTVLPATMDQDDMLRARMCQAALDFTWEKENCQAKLFRMALWSVLTGNGYLAVYWDANAGDMKETVDPETGEVLGTRPTGFPRIEVVSPLDIGLDPLAENADDCEWGYRLRLVSTSWVKKQYGKRVKGTQVPTRNTQEPEIVSRLAEADILQSVNDRRVFDGEYVTVLEWYDIQKQKFVIMLPETREIISEGEWTLPVPYIQCRAIPNVGDIEGSGGFGSHANLGETPISDTVELNQALDSAESRLLDICNLLAMPRLLVPKTALMSRNAITDQPGSQIPWSGNGQAPRELTMGNIPSWTYQHPERMKGWLYDTSGVHPVSMGMSAGSNTSGRAVAIMAEQDATTFAPHARDLSEAIRRAALMVLKLWRTYGDAPTTVRIVGRNNSLEVYEFFSDRIGSEDVMVQPGSTFAASKQLMQDKIMNAWQMGIITDPNQARRALEMGDISILEGGEDCHRLKQRRETADMLKGKPATVEDWHDNAVHLDEMIQWMNSPKFDDLDQQVKALFVQHFAEHKAREQGNMVANQDAARQRGVANAGSAGMQRQQEEMPVQAQGGGIGTANFGAGPDSVAEAHPLMAAITNMTGAKQ